MEWMERGVDMDGMKWGLLFTTVLLLASVHKLR